MDDTEITDEIKIGARNSTRDQKRIQDAHDLLVENGAVCDQPKSTTDNGNPIKSISKTDEELRVGNYIIQFSKRDLEGLGSNRINADGTRGEQFAPTVDVESDYTKTGHLYVDWEHGLDPDGIGIDENTLLGYVDWKTAKRDERGIFVERVLNRRNKYMEWLEELIEEGLISNSSEAIRGAQKTADGIIVRWPLKRDALTVNPMQWQNLKENQITALKALGVMPLKSLIPAQAEAPLEVAPVAVAEIVSKSTLEVKMELTAEQITEMVSNAAKSAVEEYRKAEPPIVKAGVSVVKDAGDQPFETSGEYFMAIKNAALYPQHSDVRLRQFKAATGMGENVPADGGYLLAPTIAGGIVERMYKSGEILSRVTRTPIGANSNGMIFNGIDETSRADGSRWGGLLGYWLSEGGTKTASQPKFRQVELKLHKVAALAYATDELLADATALESWLTRTVPEELKFRVEDAIYNGDGVGKPYGIMSATCVVTQDRDTATKILLADISNMWARRWAGVNDYVWYVNQDTIPQLMALSNTYQQLWMTSLNSALPMTLMGRPVIEIEQAASLNTTGDIMLASMSQYQLIDKGGVQAASSIHVQFLTDQTCFRFVYRVDGAPLWHSALTPFKGSNTQSPFVVLKSAS